MEKKKITIILIVLLLIFVTIASGIVLLTLSFTNNHPAKNPDPPEIESLPIEAKANNLHNGWRYDFKLECAPGCEELPETIQNAKKTLKKRCEERNGNWNYSPSSSTNPIPSCSCIFEYKDAGEPCIASFQCGGKCTGEIGIGTCSKYPIGCTTYTEIYFGFPNRVQCIQ